MNTQEKCSNAVNDILDKMETALKIWFVMLEMMPEEFCTNNIKKNIELYNNLQKNGTDYRAIIDQNKKINGLIYSNAAWLISNVISKFPDSCRTPELYLEILKRNKVIYVYSPFNIKHGLNIDCAYNNCKYTTDGTCTNCTKPAEIICSYDYV